MEDSKLSASEIMETTSSAANSNNMDLLDKSMYDISGNDLLDIWDADIASVGYSYNKDRNK